MATAVDPAMSLLLATSVQPQIALPHSGWHGQRLFISLLLISLLLHLMVLMAVSDTKDTTAVTPWSQSQQTIAVTLQTLQPAPVRPVPVATTSTPRAKPARELLPAVQEERPQEDSAAVATEASTPTATTTNSIDTPSAAAPAINDYPAREQSYLTLVRSLIESHKFYPEAARRRGLQGVVQVSFMVHPDGSISDINCSGAARLLHAAAETALRDAAPFPTALFPGDHPLAVRYEMAFRLN
jgi:protein TonB